MVYEPERQLELLMGTYRKMKLLESHTQDPVIREIVCDSNDHYSCVLISLEEAIKDALLQQYFAAESHKGED